MLKKVLLASGLMMGLGVAAMPAQATPVTAWNFTLNSGMSALACEGGGTSCLTQTELNATTVPNPLGTGYYSHVEWGVSTGFGRSSLDLGGTNGLATGPITTGIKTVMDTVTAGNHTLTADSRVMLSVSILNNLQLQATSPGGSQFALNPFTVNLVHDETSNIVNNNNPANCPAFSTFPCSDIFALVGVSGATVDSSDPANIFFGQGFMYDGENYLAKIFIQGMSLLSQTACNSVNAAAGTSLPSPNCIGFLSQEGDGGTYNVSLQILDLGAVPVPVPEPTTIALFGAGLLGVRKLRRRNKA